MLVYAKDVTKLLRESIKKYEERYELAMSTSPIKTFWRGLREDIATDTGIRLSDQTLYKTYWLKMRTHNSPVIGCSHSYLDAMSQYVHEEPFLSRFKRADSDEIEAPTFPLSRPMFPATPLMKVQHVTFSDLWIKDENTNPTGVHYDRLSHLIFIEYNKILREHFTQNFSDSLPQLSLLTDGPAGLSLQYQLRKRGLPSLKVLVYQDTPNEIIDLLRSSGAQVFTAQLDDRQELTSEWILGQTDNSFGLDATMGDEFQKARHQGFEWLSYEILNLNPHVVICPYQTGQLYNTILRVWEQEMQASSPSRRFFGSKKLLLGLQLYGGRIIRKEIAEARAEKIAKFRHSGMIPYYDLGLDPTSGIYDVTMSTPQSAQELGLEMLDLFYFKKRPQAVLLPEIIPHQRIIVVDSGQIKTGLFRDG